VSKDQRRCHDAPPRVVCLHFHAPHLLQEHEIADLQRGEREGRMQRGEREGRMQRGEREGRIEREGRMGV
jgi:hypothetical protein